MNNGISIIIPIYNAEKYLKECIESVLIQTYKQIEIILVDDGSTDSSLQICRKYIADSRVKVISIKNGGSVNARKVGTLAATHQYITYIDADDYVEKDYIECLVRQLDECQVDCIITGFTGDDASIHVSKFQSGFYEKKDLEDEVWPQMICTDKKFSFGIAPSVWGKLFLRDKMILVMDRINENVTIGDDFICTFPYLLMCNKVAVDNSNISYHYRMSNDSMTRTADSNYIFHIVSLFDCIDNCFGKYYELIGDQLIRYKAYILLQDGIVNAERVNAALLLIAVNLRRYFSDIVKDATLYETIQKCKKCSYVLEKWQVVLIKFLFFKCPILATFYELFRRK